MSDDMLVAPTGAMPSAWLAGRSCRGPPAVRLVAGVVVLRVSSNSLNTSSGFSGEPSATPFSTPLAPVPGGSDPLPVTAVSTRATPGLSASRYFVTNASHEMYASSVWLRPPNSNVTPTGPTSKCALPWNSGPCTTRSAPRLTLMVTSPSQRSTVTPAEMRACASAS